MTNPDKIHGDDPLERPASPGEAADAARAQQKNWRDRFPGWETFEGKPHDPRFESTLDPNRDSRYDTKLSGATTLPHRPGLALWVWALFLGLVAMSLLGLLMYYHFQTPSPRHPSATERTQVQPAPIRPVRAVLADTLLPLRVRHRNAARLRH